MTNGTKIQQEARSNNETGERRHKTNLSIEEWRRRKSQEHWVNKINTLRLNKQNWKHGGNTPTWPSKQ